jgi:hypothetical protein
MICSRVRLLVAVACTITVAPCEVLNTRFGLVPGVVRGCPSPRLYRRASRTVRPPVFARSQRTACFSQSDCLAISIRTDLLTLSDVRYSLRSVGGN